MKLWVLRHGQAVNQARTDAERELTPAGVDQVLHSAERLQQQPPGVILASPYVRAQQTATLVHDALRLEQPIVTVPWLTPDSDPQKVIAHLDGLGLDSVLLVSHQPLVGNLVGLLEHGHLQRPQPMQTASLVELEGDWPLAGLMTLRNAYHPQQ